MIRYELNDDQYADLLAVVRNNLKNLIPSESKIPSVEYLQAERIFISALERVWRPYLTQAFIDGYNVARNGFEKSF